MKCWVLDSETQSSESLTFHTYTIHYISTNDPFKYFGRPVMRNLKFCTDGLCMISSCTGCSVADIFSFKNLPKWQGHWRTMNNNPEQEAIGGLADQIPNAPETLHKKPMARKVPPHMRRLNMRYYLNGRWYLCITVSRFSSPSDNLSPMSQKLMLADRNNAAIKTYTIK